MSLQEQETEVDVHITQFHVLKRWLLDELSPPVLSFQYQNLPTTQVNFGQRSSPLIRLWQASWPPDIAILQKSYWYDPKWNGLPSSASVEVDGSLFMTQCLWLFKKQLVSNAREIKIGLMRTTKQSPASSKWSALQVITLKIRPWKVSRPAG